MNLLSKNSERPCVPLDELRATYRSLLTDLLDRAPRDDWWMAPNSPHEREAFGERGEVSWAKGADPPR